MMTDHQIELLENYIMKYEDSTDPKHVHLVDFARRRLERELEEIVNGTEEEEFPSKWTVNDHRGSHSWFNSDETSTYTYVPLRPVGKSILRQACKSFSWRTPRPYVWKQ